MSTQDDRPISQIQFVAFLDVGARMASAEFPGFEAEASSGRKFTQHSALRPASIGVSGNPHPPRMDGNASESLTRSDDREVAALRRVALQRLLHHAGNAEIRIRPFVDQDESTFSQQAQIGRLSWSDSLAATACSSPRTLMVAS